MKKITILLLAFVVMAGAAFAQERTPRADRGERQRPTPPTAQTIEGTLILEKGSIAVKSGDTIYLTPMLTRYIGFIAGLKENARVSVEGYVSRNMIRPVKVTIEGKSYDFGIPAPRMQQNKNFRQGNQRHRNFGPGHNNVVPGRRNPAPQG